ncbi:hypothetical protein EYZ11_004902 [Aspergillus tanneri]|uniref:Protein kinase domain-containing protein n=1 Tax=Aspergillus tanneri TaxID=1220188 RepID=A0A4S3JJY6_9EURO|nr:hypothetical protein EYZ11_004902 [Aspergillus tanneri]
MAIRQTNTRRYYPAKPGEVLANSYQVLFKVGSGVSSTVWFARDMRGYSYLDDLSLAQANGRARSRLDPESFLALKIANDNRCTADEEREIEEHFMKTDPSHRGWALFRTSSE